MRSRRRSRPTAAPSSTRSGTPSTAGRAATSRSRASTTSVSRCSSSRTTARPTRSSGSSRGSIPSPRTRPVNNPADAPVSLTLDILFGVGSLVLVVAGLFLIFGLLHVINLAHAGLMAVGVYAQVSFRGHDIPFWPAVLLSALVAGAVGALIEVVVIR